MRFVLFESIHNLSDRILHAVVSTAHRPEVFRRLAAVDIPLTSHTNNERLKSVGRLPRSVHDNLMPFVQMMDSAGVTKIFAEVGDKEYGKLFHQAKKIEAALRAAESPALLDGLI